MTGLRFDAEIIGSSFVSESRLVTSPSYNVIKCSDLGLVTNLTAKMEESSS